MQRGGERESRKGIRSEQDALLRDIQAAKKTMMWSKAAEERTGERARRRAVRRDERGRDEPE